MAAPPTSGFAEFAWPDGGTYEGEWSDGKMHGHGRYVEVDGSSYSGDWNYGKMQGKGVQIFSRGDRYEGQYHDGQRHGRGKQVFANGNSFDGEFFRGKIQGQGTYTCADGRVYVGEFRDNKKHGYGKYSGGGGAYAGEYVDGRKQGQGVFTWTDGSSYDGAWADDVMHGTGVKTTADGKRMHVSYEKGQLSTQISTLSSGLQPRVPVRKSSSRRPAPGSTSGVSQATWGGGGFDKMGAFQRDLAGSRAGSVRGGGGSAQVSVRGYEEEDGFELEEDLGPLGLLRQKWDDLSVALNCYGTLDNARDYCAPTARTCGLGQ